MKKIETSIETTGDLVIKIPKEFVLEEFFKDFGENLKLEEKDNTKFMECFGETLVESLDTENTKKILAAYVFDVEFVKDKGMEI